MGLKDLRNRAQANKDLQEVRVRRIREAVNDAVNSASFILTTAEHAEEDITKLAEKVTTNVVQAVTDAKTEFLDTCAARGLKRTDIRHAVELIDTTFGLSNSDDYDTRLDKVAEFMQANPGMYDDIAVLARK